ncbi:MAG: DUF4288 domain-containing protein [Acidobacteriota bacterium]
MSDLWFSARTVYEHDKPGDGLFEERIVLFRAGDFDEAFARAEEEAEKYAREATCSYTGYISIYEIPDETITDGVEVFSLMRDSDYPADEYIEQFFDTGRERQGGDDEQDDDVEPEQ